MKKSDIEHCNNLAGAIETLENIILYNSEYNIKQITTVISMLKRDLAININKIENQSELYEFLKYRPRLHEEFHKLITYPHIVLRWYKEVGTFPSHMVPIILQSSISALELAKLSKKHRDQAIKLIDTSDLALLWLLSVDYRKELIGLLSKEHKKRYIAHKTRNLSLMTKLRHWVSLEDKILNNEEIYQ